MGMGIMKNAETRLYLVEHPITNILAIVLITMGWSMHKRQSYRLKNFYELGFLQFRITPFVK